MKKVISIKEIQQFDYEMLLEIKRICEAHNLQYYLAFGTTLGCIRHQGFIPWDYDADVILPINSFLEFHRIAKEELNPKYELLSGFDGSFSEYFMRMKLANQDEAEVYVDLFVLVGAPESPIKQYKMYRRFMFLRSLRYYRFNNKKTGDNKLKKTARLILSKLLKLIPIGSYTKQFFKLCTKYDYNYSKYVFCPCGDYDGRKPRFFSKYIYGEGTSMHFEETEFSVPSKYDYYLTEYYKDYMIPPSDDVVKKGLAKETIIDV